MALQCNYCGRSLASIILDGQADGREVLLLEGYTLDIFLYSESTLRTRLAERRDEFPVNLLGSSIPYYDPDSRLNAIRSVALKARSGARAVKVERTKSDYSRYLLNKLQKAGDSGEFAYICGLFVESCLRGYVNVRELWPVSMPGLYRQVSSIDSRMELCLKNVQSDESREARLRAAQVLLEQTFSEAL